jgi:hypothetical protein
LVIPPDSPAKNTCSAAQDKSLPPAVLEPHKARKKKVSMADLDLWDLPNEEIIGEYYCIIKILLTLL